MTILYHPARRVKPARVFGLGLGRSQAEALPVAPYTDSDYADYLAGRTVTAAELERQYTEAAFLDRYERGHLFEGDLSGAFLGHHADADLN